MDRLVMDLRYALRQLAHSPWFTLGAVLVLAAGIGGSTAIFGAVDNIMLRPLDLPESERLVWLCEEHPVEGCFGVSPPNAAEWGERARTLEAVGQGRAASFRLERGDEVTGVAGGLATPGLFRVLGVSAALGRLIQEDDMLPTGTGRVAVISHGFWQMELGAASDVVGSTMTLTGEEYTVIGVLPEGVEVPYLDWIRVWTPLDFPPRLEENRDWRGFRTFGRLAPGSSVADAERELEGIQRTLAERYPEAVAGWGADVVDLKTHMVGRARPLLLLFLGAVVLVLGIVSVNLASFFLARATSRRREFAVRNALGADRATLARQLVVEAAVMAVLGGAAGAVVAVWTTDLFVALAPPGVPRLDEISVDGRVLGFGVAMTAFSALIFGLAPVARLGSLDVGAALKDGRSGGAGRGDARARRALVVTELALALVLVLSAGLLLRSFQTLARYDPGFEVQRMLVFEVYPYQLGWDDEQLTTYYRTLRQRLEGIAGVEAVGSASAGPLFGGGDGATPFLVRGGPVLSQEEAPRVQWYNAGPGYFPALGLAPIEGRNLSEADRLGSTPTALVNETMARRHWPDGSPVGARLSLPRWDTEVEVVGVVPDFRPFLPGEAIEPAIYVSNRQFVRGASFFVVRADGEPAPLVRAVDAAVRDVHPEIEARGIGTLEARLGSQLRTPRFNALLVSLFALIALVLGAAGVYGVMAYAVALRTREIGIRMALGAPRDVVLRSILSEGLRLVAFGLALGLLAALAFNRLLVGMLHGVSAADPWALVGTVVVLGGMALVASLLPALRASRTDPASALRVG